MSGPWQLAEIPVGGVDLRTDPLRVAPPKVLAAENVVLDGRARKRLGSALRAEIARLVRAPDGTNYAQPRNVLIREARWVAAEESGRVLLHADNLLFGESGGRWFLRGHLDQLRVTAGRIQSDGYTSIAETDAGVAGDVFVMVWAYPGKLAMYDLATGAAIHPIIALPTGCERPHCVTIPELSTCLVFAHDVNDTNRLYCIPVVGPHVRGAALSDFTPIVIDTFSGRYDVAVVGQRVVLVHKKGTDIVRRYIGPNGQPDGASQTEPLGAGAVDAIAVAYSPVSGRFLVAWGDTAGNALKARDYNADATLSANAAVTTIDTLTNYKRITIGVRGTTWTLLYETGDAVLHNRLVTRAEWNTAGAPALPGHRLRHASLRSKLWQDPTTDRWYCVVAYERQTQPSVQVTFFVYGIRGFDDGADPGVYEEPFVLVGIVWPGFAGGVLQDSHHLTTPAIIGRTVRMALTYRTQQTEAGKTMVARPLTLEHAPADMMTLAQGPDGASYVPGGMLWRIDEGADGIVTEAGFALGPENVSAVGQAGGAKTASASYNHRYYYRDVTTGERSAAVGTVTVATGVGQGTIQHTVQTLTHTRHRNVVIDIYSTAANPNAASPFYLAQTVANVTTADTVVTTDALADAVLITRARDYLTLGELSEAAPPACEAIAIGQGRAALSIDEDGTLRLSKQRGSGEPLRWSDLLIAIADHPVPGRPTALAWNGADLVVWRSRAIQVLGGRGPANSGAGGTLEATRAVSLDVGCRSARSLVRIPGGWLFQAIDGTYWALDLNYQLSFVGQDVEPHTEPCLGAFLVLARKQAHFVTAAGELVFHYDIGQWTTSTRGAVSAAVTPDGTALYLPSSSSARLLEDDDSYRDDGVEYNQRLRLAWFRPGGLQGEFELGRLLLAGGLEGLHRALIRVYYDYEPGHQETFEWRADEVVETIVAGDGTQVFGGPSRRVTATQAYHFAVPLARRRCMSVGIEILDRSVGGASELGASFWLSAIGYEWRPVQAAGAAGYRLEERRMAEVV